MDAFTILSGEELDYGEQDGQGNDTQNSFIADNLRNVHQSAYVMKVHNERIGQQATNKW